MPLSFSTLLINSCGYFSGKPTTVTLKISPSFPGGVWYQEEYAQPAPATWDSKDVSEANGILEVELLERIAEGRIGATFTAKVVSATHDGIDVRLSLPPTLCLKFAKPEFSRSLAREAWFYEQMEALQGISIPDSFGFYSSTLAQQPHFPELEYIPWTTRWYSFEDTDADRPGSLDKYPSLDFLPDDAPYWTNQCKIVHHPPCMLDSPWYKWDRNDANRTITVLVLELLGKDCPEYSGHSTQKAVKALLADIGAAGISHGNISPWNVLAFQDDSLGRSRLCPQHNIVHRWRIIDFDQSHRFDVNNISSRGKVITTGDQSTQLALGGFRFSSARRRKK